MHGEKGEPAFPVAEECRRAARGALGALIVKRNDVCWFAEPWLVPPRMILCGGGHVAQAVVPVAGGAGLEVTVLDDRGRALSDLIDSPEPHAAAAYRALQTASGE